MQSSSTAQTESFSDGPEVTDRKPRPVMCTWYFHRFQHASKRRCCGICNKLCVLQCFRLCSDVQLWAEYCTIPVPQRRIELNSCCWEGTQEPQGQHRSEHCLRTPRAQQWLWGDVLGLDLGREVVSLSKTEKWEEKKCSLLRERRACWGYAVSTKSPAVLVWGSLGRTYG